MVLKSVNELGCQHLVHIDIDHIAGILSTINISIFQYFDIGYHFIVLFAVIFCALFCQCIRQLIQIFSVRQRTEVFQEVLAELRMLHLASILPPWGLVLVVL